MAKVVMLTALVGDGIDIVNGDVCECSTGEANSLLVVGYAREYAADGSDDKRPVKSLNSAAKKADQAEPAAPDPKGTVPPQSKPARRRGQKEPKDANQDGSQGEEA
jgi:hypothetical protein